MKQVPSVEILNMDGGNFLKKLSSADKKNFCNACPTKVFRYDENKDEIIVDKPEKCTYCEECQIKTQEFIKKKDKEEYNLLVSQKVKEGKMKKIFMKIKDLQLTIERLLKLNQNLMNLYLKLSQPGH